MSVGKCNSNGAADDRNAADDDNDHFWKLMAEVFFHSLSTPFAWNKNAYIVNCAYTSMYIYK